MDFRTNCYVVADSVEYMKDMPPECVDLTVTSPPYDDLRDYKGFRFNALHMLVELERVTKTGGVVIWVVGDKTKDGDRSLSSFRHAFDAKTAGFLVHDVMVYAKHNPPPWTRNTAYTNAWEMMYVFSKGIPKTFNPLRRDVVWQHRNNFITYRLKDGSMKKKTRAYDSPDMAVLNNIWTYRVGKGHSAKEKEAYRHPAIFPEKLAEDHIRSWTNKGDLVFDPMCGSGTTCKMAKVLDRRWLGIDISEEYIEIARERTGNSLLDFMDEDINSKV